MKITFIFLFSTIWLGLFAQNGSQKILVTDITKIKQVIGTNISPDGKKAIYLLKSIEQNPENKLEYDYRIHLYLVDLQSTDKTIKALTRGNESISEPTFSPDGKSVAFIRAVKGKPQVFVMPLDGGEAWQLTDTPYGASRPKYSPDGSKILFSATISLTNLLNDSILNPLKNVPNWSIEKPAFAKNEHLKRDKKVKPNPDGNIDEIRAYLDKNVEDKKAKVFNRLNFQGEAVVEPELLINHLFTIDVREGAKAKNITTGFNSYNQASWSPDGKMIWAIVAKDKNKHPDREQETAVISMFTDGSGEKQVISESGKSFSGYDISPDGKRIGLNMSTPNLLSFTQLVIANTDGTGRQVIEFDRTPNNLKWSADSRNVYFTAPSNGGIPLYKLDVNSKKVEQLSDFDSGIQAFDITSDKILFSKTEIFNPSELYMADLSMKNQVRISNHNDNWLINKKVSIPEKRIFTNSKGQNVEFWIMKPTFLVAGKKYPLLLNMHGGPTAMWGPGEFSMWHEFQYMCSQGYGIVYANPRGSGGYGKDFQFANYRDWGTGPQEDILAACTAAAKESWVDTARQVITGGSYAGYLTAWIISKDHRFKAAFAQRGVYDLTTFMGEGNAWRLVPNYFGLPWEDQNITKIDANSPYTFVKDIKTPLLIKHGENDLRTGVIQSQMMYKSMKYLNKNVEYVLMPGATHELSRSGNIRQRIDRLLRIYEFFERYVGKN